MAEKVVSSVKSGPITIWFCTPALANMPAIATVGRAKVSKKVDATVVLGRREESLLRAAIATLYVNWTPGRIGMRKGVPSSSTKLMLTGNIPPSPTDAGTEETAGGSCATTTNSQHTVNKTAVVKDQLLILFCVLII